MTYYQYNKDEIKKNLTIEQVRTLVAELGGEPQPIVKNVFISRTISHNARGEGSFKLYYYQNDEQGIFRDYTGGESFDIFELVRRVKSREEPLAEGIEWSLPQAVAFVAQYYGFEATEYNEDNNFLIQDDWRKFENYERIKSLKLKIQSVELKEYDDTILKNLPRPIIVPWIKDHITKEVMDNFGICYDPKANGIVIPHRDINGRLVGIRERTLTIEDAELYGKYRPAYISGKLYNHPLSLNLYGIHKAKDTIKDVGKVFVFESEKSVLQYCSYFGIDSSLAVAVCGSSLTSYHIKLLQQCGAKEIIIAFDKAGSNNDKTQYVKKFYEFNKRFGNYVNLSFMYDKDDKYLDFKESPSDRGQETFMKMFQERIII